MQGAEKTHIFLSSESAYIYSLKNNMKAQGLHDLLYEIASRVRINPINWKDTIRLFLEAGADFEDIEVMLKIKNFLKKVDREKDIHKIPVDLYYQKRIERISSVIVRYYTKLTELKKNELEDVVDFLSFFGVKFNKDGYISHIPEFYKKFSNLFNGCEIYKGDKSPSIVVKKRFPDYWAESRWIANSVSRDSGLIGIVAPDDISIIDISNELYSLGIRNSVISPVPYFIESHSSLDLIKSMLLAIDQNYAYDQMMSLLTNPLLKLKDESITKIKKASYENNVTSGWANWELILNDFKEMRDLLSSLARSMGNKEQMIREFVRIRDTFMERDRDKITELLDIISLLDEEIFKDPGELINYLELASHQVKKYGIPDGNVIIGKPEDMLGLNFDKVYISRLDTSSSGRSFPQDARDILLKMEGSDIYEEFLSSMYSHILENSGEAVLTYSALDNLLNYTESVSFYDGVMAQEENVGRISIFNAITGKEIDQNIPKEKYIMDQGLVNKILENTFSPTSLEIYLDCHFKYLLQSLLYIQEIDEPSEFIDARLAGSLTHRILQENYSMNISPKEFQKRAGDLIDSEIRRTYYPSKKRALEFYRRKYISNGKLAKFFFLDVRNAIERGRNFVAAELQFGKEKNVFYEIESKRLLIKGIVDRIDETKDGLSIIDYKTSLNEYPAGSLCNERKVQLFFYKLGVEQVYGRKVTAAAYVSFRDTAEGYQTRGLYEGIVNEQMEINNCRNIIDPAISSLTKGDFDAYIKESKDINKCETVFYCPFLSVCRGQERRW